MYTKQQFDPALSDRIHHEEQAERIGLAWLKTNAAYLESIGFSLDGDNPNIKRILYRLDRIEQINFDHYPNRDTVQDSFNYLAWLLRMLESSPESIHSDICNLDWHNACDVVSRDDSQGNSFANRIGAMFADDYDHMVNGIYFSPLHAPFMGMTQSGHIYYRDPRPLPPIVNINNDSKATRTFARALSNLAAILDGTKNRYSNENIRIHAKGDRLVLDTGEFQSGIYAKAEINLYGTPAYFETIANSEKIAELCRFGDENQHGVDMCGVSVNDRGSLVLKIGVGTATLHKGSIPCTKRLCEAYKVVKVYNAAFHYRCQTPPNNWRMETFNKVSRTLKRSVRRNARLSRFTKHLVTKTLDFPEYEESTPKCSITASASALSTLLNGAVKVAESNDDKHAKHRFIELYISTTNLNEVRPTSTLAVYATNGYLMHIDSIALDSMSDLDHDYTVKLSVEHYYAIKRFMSYCESITLHIHDKHVVFSGTLKSKTISSAVCMYYPTHEETFSFRDFDRSHNKGLGANTLIETDGYMFHQIIKGLATTKTQACVALKFETTQDTVTLSTESVERGVVSALLHNKPLLTGERTGNACIVAQQDMNEAVCFNAVYLLEFLGKLGLSKAKAHKADSSITLSYGDSNCILTVQCKGKTLKLMPMGN